MPAFSGFPGIKAFNLKIQSNRSNPEAEKSFCIQEYENSFHILWQFKYDSGNKVGASG
jgi:hypothetical protein